MEYQKRTTEMKTIISTNHGTVHHIAFCQYCGWTDAINTNEENRSQALRNRVNKHVRATGHIVHVEAGTSIEYCLEENS